MEDGSQAPGSGKGAGWMYHDTVFFSANDGGGVFKINLETIDITDTTRTTLRKIGGSDPTDAQCSVVLKTDV